MIILIIVYELIMIIEFCFSIFVKDEVTLGYFAGYRKIIMYLVQHFKAFSLLLINYYVGLNSQRKSSKKSKKHDNG